MTSLKQLVVWASLSITYSLVFAILIVLFGSSLASFMQLKVCGIDCWSETSRQVASLVWIAFTAIGMMVAGKESVK